jgi:importin-9
MQSLIIPFCFLIHNQRDAVLDIVEKTEPIEGRSGLDILLNTWCENAATFQGFWPIRISTLALCQMVLSERESVRSIKVKGAMIVKPETRNGKY